MERRKERFLEKKKKEEGGNVYICINENKNKKCE